MAKSSSKWLPKWLAVAAWQRATRVQQSATNCCTRLGSSRCCCHCCCELIDNRLSVSSRFWPPAKLPAVWSHSHTHGHTHGHTLWQHKHGAYAQFACSQAHLLDKQICLKCCCHTHTLLLLLLCVLVLCHLH